MLKKDRKRILALLTLLAVLIGIFAQPTRDASANDTPRELSTSFTNEIDPEVNITLSSIRIQAKPNWETHPFDSGLWADEGGNKISFYKGRQIEMDFNWNIANTEKMKAGDYFMVPLSEAIAVDLNATTGPIKVHGKDDEVGHFEITEKRKFKDDQPEVWYAKLILNENGVNAGSLTSGNFKVVTRLSAAKKQSYLLYAPLNKIAYPVYFYGSGSGGSNTGTGTGSVSSDIRKYSSGIRDSKNVHWNIHFNLFGHKQIIENTKPIEEQTNVFITDHLPKGLEPPKQLNLSPLFYVPYSENVNRMGNHELSTYNGAYNNHFTDPEKTQGNDKIAKIREDHFRFSETNGKLLKSNDGETFEEFKERVKQEKKAGIFKNDDGSHIIVYFLPKVPMDLTYYNFYNGDAADNSSAQFETFVNSFINTHNPHSDADPEKPWISENQATKILSAFGPSGPTQGRILGFALQYSTPIENPQDGQAFINSVNYTSDQVPSPGYESSQTAGYSSALAGAQVPEFEIKKVWGSSDQNWNDEMKNSSEVIQIEAIPYIKGTDRSFENLKQVFKLSKGNNWLSKSKLQIRYLNGEELEYRVREVGSSKFELSSITSNIKENEGKIDNSHITQWVVTNVKPKETLMDVTVITTDCKGDSITAPQEISLRLERKIENGDYEDVSDPAAGSSSSTWIKKIAEGEGEVKFEDLPKFDKSGNPYTYRVVPESTKTPGYTMEVIGTAVGNKAPSAIKVKICPVKPPVETIDIQVETMDCGDNVTAPPQNVTVKLQKSTDGTNFEDVKDPADSNQIWTKTISTSENSVKFEDLPKKDDQDHSCIYKIEVTSGAIADYDMELNDGGVAGDNNANTIKIKICPKQKPIQNISVTVQTTDCSGAVQAPAEDVEVRIQKKNQNGEFVFITNPDNNNELYSLIIKKDTTGLDPSKVGKAVFEKLPETDTNGNVIEYKVVVTSDAIAGHVMSLSDDGMANSNNAHTVSIKICPVEKINVTVQHTDCSDTVVEVPDDIAIILERKLAGEDDLSYAPVVENGQKVQTVLQKGQHNSHTFSDLPKSNDKGKEYVYRVTMNPTQLNGYVTTLSDGGEAKSSNGYTVTIKNCKNFDVTVQNKNCANEVIAPPVDFTITLQRKLKGAGDDSFANVKVNGVDLTSTLSKAGNGTYQFTDLPKFSPSGVEYVYRVVFNPDKVDQYETTIEDAGIVREDKGFVVTVKNCPLGTGGPSNPPSNPTPPTTPDTSDDSSSDNSGSGTVSHVERLTPDPNKPQGSQKPQDPNKAQDPKKPQSPSDSGSNSDTSSGNTTTEKPVDPITGNTASTDDPSTDVKPGVIPGLSSGTGTKNPNTAVDPANKGKLPKTGEGLNMETYAMMLAFLGVSLVGYGVLKRKRRNH